MFTTSTIRIRPNFRENQLLQTRTVLYALVWIVTAIELVYPSD